MKVNNARAMYRDKLQVFSPISASLSVMAFRKRRDSGDFHFYALPVGRHMKRHAQDNERACRHFFVIVIAAFVSHWLRAFVATTLQHLSRWNRTAARVTRDPR
jgi:hypothetical protein